MAIRQCSIWNLSKFWWSFWTKIKKDNVANCDVGEDSKKVQCNLLCTKQNRIENFQNNAEAVQY